jgi:hypothetical protein
MARATSAAATTTDPLADITVLQRVRFVMKRSIRAVSVLDRVDAGQYGVADAVGRRGMGGHGARFVNYRLSLGA